jgi:CheY-like chemotaxis protein
MSNLSRSQITSIGGARSVLVVDDESLIRMLVGRWLGTAGYRVIDAPTARHAVEIMTDASHVVDLLVTDLAMPGMDGRQLIAWTHQARPGLPILCMTGHAEDVPRGLRVLDKPFRGPQFLEAVRAALDSSVLSSAAASG